MDRHLQRIMGTAAGSSDQIRSGHTLCYSFGDGQPAEYGIGTAPRLNDDPMLLNELDRGLSSFESNRQPSAASSRATALDRGTYNIDLPRHPSAAFSSAPVPEHGSYNFKFARRLSTASGTAPTRLSIAPQSIFYHQESEPRIPTHADNQSRFAQNLRQGVPMNRAPPPPLASNFNDQQQAQSPLTQLANGMLMERPMPQPRHEQMNHFQSQNNSMLSQLQPRRQEITPPFNLSGFSFSPNNRNATSSSSPAALPSSPTARISLRRAATRVAPSPGAHENEYGFDDTYEDTMAPSGASQRQMTAPVTDVGEHLPQIPAIGHMPPTAHGIQLVSPYQLPDRFRQVFPYELFNAVQSKCFSPIYESNDNVVVSAPTGSGKTALLELAICRLVEGHSSGQFKIIYQAPTKSLCSERIRDWQKKFSHLNLACAELTGDTGHAEMNRVGAASIIVTTPEKWDSITRKWKDHSRLLQLVKLFLIDEVHILKDTRGATLEAVVSRMKTSGANVRFVALSATVPNSEDIAMWLGKDHTNGHIPAHRESFGEAFRPVQLQKHVYGFDGLPNEFAFEKILDGKLPNLIRKHAQQKPIMVFCFTRKSCETTATKLAEWWTKQKVGDRAWPAPARKTVAGNKELRELIGSGVAFHHAGLDPQDRHVIETAFLKGDISLICCTSTLAVGVNLPCHLVVLKGTVCFQDGNLCEYSDLEVMQMLGRAGRPQFDDSAIAIIMTRSDKAERYEKMISGQDILESTLHLNLIEHLNSEIALGTVHDLYTAKRWLTGTFLSVRMRQNPNYYKLHGVPPNRDADERLSLVCERDIKLLEEHELIANKEDRLIGTEYGQAMSRYMVQFETMKLLLSLGDGASTGEILHLLCQATEFKDLRMKPNERSSLREFNKSPFVKFPIKENISTTVHKISLMIQVKLGGVELPTDKDFNVIRRQFNMETSLIFERVQRLIRCIVDCKAYKCDAVATRHGLDLARSLSAEFWENSNLQLRQVPQVGPAAHRKLVTSEINSVEKLMSQDTATIERIMGKNPPFGRKILDVLVGFPLLKMTAEIVGKPITTGKNPKVNVKVILGFSNAKIPAWKSSRPSVTFTAETSQGKLVHFWRGGISKLEKGYELKFCVELETSDDKIKCHGACDEIVGTLRYCRLDPEVPASAFPRPKPKQTTLPSQTIENKLNYVDADEFGIDDIKDDELLAAAEEVEASKNESDSDDFVDIDNFGDLPLSIDPKKVQTEATESFKMENGKWTCLHQCRGGKVLKNGQPCKHRCCKEGLDKRPGSRRIRTKSSVGTGELPPTSNTQKNSAVSEKEVKGKKPTSNKVGSSTKVTNPRAAGSRNSKLKVAKHSNSDQQDVEVIDLAEEFSPMSPEHRKLRSLHASVQKSDTSVRLRKQKPQFSYAIGTQPDLSFLSKFKVKDDGYNFGSEESDLEEDFASLPAIESPSTLANRLEGDTEDPWELGNVEYEEAFQHSADRDNSLESLEADLLSMDTPMQLRPPTPTVNSSYASGVFDFEAFEKNYGESDVYSSPLLSTSQKRELSPSALLPESKYRRGSQGAETISAIRNSVKEQGSDPLAHESSTPSGISQTQDLIEDPKPKVDQNTQEQSVPSWVNEFDADLIQSLLGSVDFVD